jgi:hypothetical protein
MNHRDARVATPLVGVLVAGLLVGGCTTTKESASVTISQIAALESFDSLLPVAPDSVIELYRRNDPQRFHATYAKQLDDAGRYVDSLNSLLDARSRIDTLAVDHSFENFGMAACSGHTIYLSSSYFLLYGDPAVVRSVITHEFGHVIYQLQPEAQRKEFEETWTQLRAAALLYLFRDGEYSGNARFGGHPYESASELFASAFNLFSNREKELTSRLQYVTPNHLPLIEHLKSELDAMIHKRSP